MKNSIECQWNGDMEFSAEVSGHKVIMDADIAVGGKNNGPRPKALLLAGLAGCTGMDVVSILKKMQVFPDSFRINVDADMSEEHPKVYEKIRLTYIFKGNNLPVEKLERAIVLSQDKYCGVSAMFKPVAELTWELRVE